MNPKYLERTGDGQEKYLGDPDPAVTARVKMALEDALPGLTVTVECPPTMADRHNVAYNILSTENKEVNKGTPPQAAGYLSCRTCCGISRNRGRPRNALRLCGVTKKERRKRRGIQP